MGKAFAWFLRIALLSALSAMVLWPTGFVQAQSGQLPACDNVRYLMQRDITPTQLSMGGGDLRPGSTQGVMQQGHYMDVWSLILERPRNANNIPIDVQFNLSFANSNLQLEYAVFYGLNVVQPYRPITNPFNQLIRRDGSYTVTVRRVNVADQRVGAYDMTLDTDSTRAIRPASTTYNSDIRNVTNNAPWSPAPQLRAGVVNISLPTVAVRVHPDGSRLVHGRNGNSAQVYFPDPQFNQRNSHTMHLGTWASEWDVLGGTLSVVGDERIYFLENFDYRVNLSGINSAELDLTDVTYPDGTQLRIDWSLIRGIWMMDDCVGYKLRDGRTFTAPIAPNSRNLRLGGALEQFELVLNSLDAQGNSIQHRYQLDYRSIRPNSEVTLANSVLSMALIEGRDFAVQTTDATIQTQPPVDGRIQRLDATLRDQDTTITLDWFNMNQFSLANGLLRFTFTDVPRGLTQREGRRLSRFEALNDVVHILYKDLPDGAAGAERLLLPRQESYLEIITPAGDPPFDARRLPHESGYYPRALNNLGGDCYPANSVIPIANCAPNGHPNPANGNLWYSITDHSAAADLLDLTLVRNYNSRNNLANGPFGYGWTTNYLLDYNIPFDASASSRPLEPQSINYDVHLDVRWAPRGIARFTTPSGSQHQFVSTEPTNVFSEMRALTMPGWRLERSNLRDATWRLYQDTGLYYEFDRAGRLLRYGYPEAGRIIEIDYPRTTLLTGPGGIGVNTPIVITDQTGSGRLLRQLELYYNTDHRIVRSVLRDMTQNGAATQANCTVAQNCFEALYTYRNDLLTQVTYNDGRQATYNYDGNTRQLIAHDDPYAPIAPRMLYDYGNDGSVTSIDIVDPTGAGAPVAWRRLNSPSVSSGVLSVAVTNELGNTQQYRYTFEPGNLRRAGGEQTTPFALIEVTSPLAVAGQRNNFENIPTGYQWQNGLLMRVVSRILLEQQGRNSIDFVYTTNGRIACVACNLNGTPSLRVNYTPNQDLRAPLHQPQRIEFADGSVQTFTYDAQGRIATHTDGHGAVYLYNWSDNPQRVSSIVRQQDGKNWRYQYNDLGLITQVQETFDTVPGSGYLLRYDYDGLGRVVQVQDSILGSYSITYERAVGRDAGQLNDRITLTDPVGIETISHFTSQGILINQTVLNGNTPLRGVRYTYDALNRLTSEARLLNSNASGGAAEELVTEYRYTPSPTREPLVSGEAATLINGYDVVVTNPSGSVRIHTYDALGRLQQVVDEQQRVSQYDYDVRDSGFINGLLIRQRTRLSGSPEITETTYSFDLRWQLRNVSRRDQVWGLTAAGNTSRQGSLKPTVRGSSVALLEVLWDDYIQGRPSAVRARQSNIDLNSGFNTEANHRPSFDVTYDFAGRPLRQASGETNTLQMRYCPGSQGVTRVVYAYDPPGNLACDSLENADLALTHDVHGRLTQSEDRFGLRTFRYTPEPNLGSWRVEAVFNSTDGQTYTWLLRYNGVGDLIEWRNQDSVQTTYEYDLLGQLLRTDIPGQPELSFRYRYDEAGLLQEVLDGLGRGFLYNYNELGKVVSRLDARTADATSYAYTPTGELAAIISSLGGTTTYLYEDPIDPSRLTSIIEPTGNQQRYIWNDTENSLTYIDSVNRETIYSFDGMGLLWRIDDPVMLNEITARSHELQYDDNGNLTGWLSDIRLGNPRAAQNIAFNAQNRQRFVANANTDSGNWSATLRFGPQGQLLNVDRLRMTYDPLYRLQTIGVGSDTWTLARSDQAARVRLTDPFENQALYEYDARFNPTRTLINGALTNYVYVADDTDSVRLTALRDDVGQRTYIFFPGNAQRAQLPSVTLLAHGQRIIYRYDTENLLQEIVHETCSNPELATVDECEENGADVWRRRSRVSYDALGRPTQVVDANGNQETFGYDAANNLVSYQDTVGRTVVYQYDAANRLTQLTLQTGVKLLISYTLLDQIAGICRTRIEEPNDYARCQQNGGELETYTYDALGRMTRRTYNTGNNQTTTQNFRYDANNGGRLAGWTVGNAAVGLEYNDLGLLQQMVLPGQRYEFSYASLNQLATAGDLAFSYDEFGRVARYNHGGTAWQMRYASDGFLMIGPNNVAATYAHDPRGLFSFFRVGSALLPTAGARYTGESFAELDWQDGTISIYELGGASQTQSLQYLGLDYYAALFNDLTPNERIQKQTITLQTNLSAGGQTNGYVEVIGYDNDERPLTMRLTDTAGLRVLYTQSNVYDPVGNRLSESRQYNDGTQVIINYVYDTSGLLTRQLVTVIEPLRVLGLPALLLLLLIVLRQLNQRNWRNWRKLAPLAVLGLLVLISPVLSQQQRGGVTTSFNYTYDDRGNLTSIRTGNTTCASFVYDALNRVVEAERGDKRRAYAYDAYNRLTQADNQVFTYQGNSTQVLSASVEGEHYYFGQTNDKPPFALADTSGDVTWLINDGQHRLLGALSSNANIDTTLYLFDPFGRYLTTDSPNNNTDPCSLVVDDLQLAHPLTVQPFEQSGMWDTEMGFFIKDGRLWQPYSARYAQRDPLGPDVQGRLYDGVQRQGAPAMRERTPIYTDGLYNLRTAIGLTRINERLNAQAIRAAAMPSLTENISQFASNQNTYRQPFDDTLYALINLPLWLEAQYNLGAPYLDAAAGYPIVPNTPAPAQNVGDDFVSPIQQGLPRWADALAQPIQPPLSYLERMLGAALPPADRLFTPVNLESGLAQRLQLDALWQAHPSRPAEPANTPEAVFAWLPGTIIQPQNSAYALDLVRETLDLLNRPPYAWAEAALAAALPQIPELPPTDMQSYLDAWFTEDIFGTLDQFQLPLPQVPDMPLYGLRDNSAWLRALEP